LVAVRSAEALQLEAKAALLERPSPDGDGAGGISELRLIGGQSRGCVDRDDPVVARDDPGRTGIPIIRERRAATEDSQQRSGDSGPATFSHCGVP